MDPNTLPNQPAPEVSQPTSVATPVQPPVFQPQQPVIASNPLLTSVKKDKGLLVVAVLVGLLIIGGVFAYYSGSNINKSSSLTTLTRSQVANSTQAQANAQTLVSITEIYAAENDYYPASAAEIMSYNGPAKLPSGITVLPDSDVSPINADNGLDHVAWACLETCANSTGGRITYWDYKTDAISTNVYYVGDADVSSKFVYPTF